MRTKRVFALTVLCCVASSREARVQQPSGLGAVTLTHAAVSVGDLDKAARLYADILGLPMPAARTVTIDVPGGKADVKLLNFALPNFRIELNEPIAGASPMRTFLDTYGPGLQHIGLTVQDGVPSGR